MLVQQKQRSEKMILGLGSFFVTYKVKWVKMMANRIRSHKLSDNIGQHICLLQKHKYG